VTVTLGAVLDWAPGADAVGAGVTGTASVWLTSHLAAGLSVRGWGATVTDRGCSGTSSECVVYEESSSIAGIVTGTAYPFGKRYAFIRVGAGVSALREQQPSLNPETLTWGILTQLSWPATLLIGIGSDIRVASWVFISPIAEGLYTFVGDDTLRSTQDWVFKIGVGVTVG